MGYTHYWNRDKAEIPQHLWDKAVAKIKPILTKHASLLRDVEVTSDSIFFNGDCETFYVQRDFKHPDYVPVEHRARAGYFAFCKTRARGYDPVVVACLLILADTCKGDPVGFRWSSDGNFPEEHMSGIEVAGFTPETAPAPRSE